MKKHFIEAKNFGGFVTFYLPCVMKHCKDIWMLLTDSLHIRNTDPRFHLVSCYKKHFRSLMKNAVFYMRDVTVWYFIA